MFGWLTSSKAPPREALVTAVPVRNPQVRIKPLPNGGLRLTGTLKGGWLKKAFGTGATEKSFELDELGAGVWEACDGKDNIERIITGFAARHRVNVREAEVAVTSFLKMLLRRNLVALAGTQDPRPPKNRKRRKKG